MLQNILLGGALFVAYKIYRWTKCPKELEHLPTASVIDFFKFSLDNNQFPDKMKAFQPLFNEHGVIKVLSHFGWSVLVSDPKIAKEIFNKSDIFSKQDFTKREVSKTVEKLFGPSNVVVNNFGEWKRHRKIINPIFNQTWSTEVFGACAQDLIDEWIKEDGKEVKVSNLIQRMTLDVFGKYIFDIDFNAVKDQDSEIYHLYTEIFEEIFGAPIYFILPFLDNTKLFGRPELSKKLDRYHEFVQSIIKQKKEDLDNGSEKPNQNLISAFLKSNEMSEDQKLTMDEIRDNILVFIIAGHDTTSNTLSTTLYYLARYPEIQDKLRAQILHALGSPSSVQIPTIEQLKNIPLLDMVNKESMRIMTTAVTVQRVATEDHTLSNGLTIPKDTNIWINLWGIHHNDKFFKNPEEFIPERFESLSSEDSRNWLPFITGARSCVGNTFSLVEQRVTISMLLQKFEFSISSDNPDYHKLRISSNSIVRPIDLGLNIKVRM